MADSREKKGRKRQEQRFLKSCHKLPHCHGSLLWLGREASPEEKRSPPPQKVIQSSKKTSKKLLSSTLRYVRLRHIIGLLTQDTGDIWNWTLLFTIHDREIWERWLGILQGHVFPSSERCSPGKVYVWGTMCFPVLFYSRCSYVVNFYKVAWVQMDNTFVLKCESVWSPCPSQRWTIMRTQKELGSLTNKRWAGTLQGEDRQNGLVFIVFILFESEMYWKSSRPWSWSLNVW